MIDTVKMQRIVDEGLLMIKIGPLDEAIKALGDEITQMIFEYEDNLTLARQKEIKLWKYQLGRMNDRMEMLVRRQAKRNKAAVRYRKDTNADKTISDNKLVLALVKQLTKAPQIKAVGSGRKAYKEPSKVLKHSTPKNYEEALENIEPLKNDPLNYKVAEGILKKKWHENNFTSTATAELTGEFVTPPNSEGEIFGYHEDGTPVNMLEYLNANPGRKKVTCETKEEYNERIAWEIQCAHYESLSDAEKQAYNEAEDEKRKIAAEEIRLQKLEHEKTMAIKRKVDQLIADAKAKEEVKCLIPKKSTVQGVEELLGSQESQ